MTCHEEGGQLEPACSLIRRLGGAREVARGVRKYSVIIDGDRRARALNHATVFRWTISVDRNGTGGLIPLKYWPAIIKLGREHGLTLRIEDLSPRVAEAFAQAQQEGAALATQEEA